MEKSSTEQYQDIQREALELFKKKKMRIMVMDLKNMDLWVF